MKAVAVFPAQKQVKLIDAPAPSLKAPTDVKLRMLDIGVCGTDKEICAFEYGTPPPAEDHLILGHESLGRVVEVGPEVKDLKPGDLAVMVVRRPCPHAECVPCGMARQDFCVTGDFTERGINGLHGFMTEYVVDDERFMVPVPASLRPIAVLAEPLTIAEKGLEQMWQIQSRLPWDCPHVGGGRTGRGHCHNAVVLGAGPVGLLGAMLLRSLDFNTYVYSKEAADSPKARLAQSLGAVFVSGAATPLEALAQKAGPVDLVYEATGASRLSYAMMPHLGTNGVFIFTGVPGRKAPIEVDTDLLMRDQVLKNQVVFGTVNAGKADYGKAIADLALFERLWPDAAASLITGRFAPEKFQDLLTGDPGGIKNVVTFGD